MDLLKDKESKASISFFFGFRDEAAIMGRACIALRTVLEQNDNNEVAKKVFLEEHKRLIAVLCGDRPNTLKAKSKLLLQNIFGARLREHGKHPGFRLWFNGMSAGLIQ